MKITLRALRELVGSTKGIKLPTAKALRESGVEVVADASVGADGKLTVYRNGFYIYQTNIGATVHAVDRCKKHIYDGDDAIDASFLDDEMWSVRLTLEGEDRLERNNNAREESSGLHHGGDVVDYGDPYDFLTDLESRETVEQMMECLTARQRQVVKLYFFDGLTQQDIARSLGVSQRAVAYQIESVRKKLADYFHGYF